ncbi:nucleoside phosphatase GDA1/CD39 [Syncephalis plumigaleata]|nr:nucleoside phosphatase GDA1/CD39 [Syncephalis plumigaleata]
MINESREYVIVIDAGSSGSRVHVYSWKSPELQRSLLTTDEWTRLPVVELGNGHGFGWQLKQEPGLSTFADKAELVHQHMIPLIDFAKSVIPSDAWAQTQVYLLATAGMRLVPMKQQTEVLTAACDYIRASSPFSVDNCHKQIKVISGEMEGVYGWVTVNYLLDGFEKALPSNLRKGRTFGFSDMGGASTQLVFEPSVHVADEHRHDMTEVRLRRLDGSVARHDVFVTTFLGFGTNQARQRHLKQLELQVKQSNSSASFRDVIDYCLPLGAEDMLLDGTRITGGGSFDKCLEHTMPLLNKTAECPEKPCLFNGVHTPEIDYQVHRFVGVSDWWYSMHDILGLGGDYDASTFKQAAHRYCQMSWDQIVAEHEAGRFPSSVNRKRLHEQCFKAAWLSNILHEGFGVPRTTTTTTISSTHSHFQSLDNANGIPFSWTLGAAMMYAVSPVEIGGVVGPLEAATFRHWWTTTWRAAIMDGWPPADASPLLPWVWLIVLLGYLIVVTRMTWLIRRFARKRAITHLGYL